MKKTILLVASAGLLVSCMKSATPNATTNDIEIIKIDPITAVAHAKQIREKSAIELAEGLEMTLWASDSLAPDPVAIDIDATGAVYLNRTNRQKNSEFDIRGHRDWMTPSIALQTVEDRRAFLRKTFAPENSRQNLWLKDLNEDGSHDWRDLAVEKEEIWKIEDTNNDGVADISTRVLNDFNEEITDVAGGVLVRKNDAFVAVGPDMWRLEDTNDDGKWDKKTAISHGYAVHIGFGGHGMSGVIEGPDGKIYWNIGDIGANIVSKDGKKFEYPNEGIIARCNPDGSNFEVFASGLRNTHEFVFDEYGNLISSDNDGDHPGESERLVHIVEGSDAGWRSNWQYGKYTDPKNNLYKVWMDEKLFKPRWEGQAAYIIPPIMNYHNGPTGMQYNPGTALGKEWLNKFFLVEFVGNPARSPIWAFDLKPKGASFELKSEKKMMQGILPTGIRFGTDGALYVADWVNGWNTKNYGRVWRIDVTKDQNDLAEIRKETKRLMEQNYTAQTNEALYKLLFYADRRVRQKAQFELALRGTTSMMLFQKAVNQTNNQLARIHGIWGIGQLAQTDKNLAAPLVSLLTDSDPEIIAQAAKIIGESDYPAGALLQPLLSNENPRVQFFAAQAMGRLRYKEAIPTIIALIGKNNDKDVYIRHAGVLALARIGEIQPLVALADSPSRALRIAAVVALRRMKSPEVAIFLKDNDEYIVTEAARAINDDLSILAAFPALAATLADNRFTSEPLIRRAINANLRLGGEKDLDRLIDYAERQDAPTTLRAEALATIGSWANPSVLDRVDGRYRGELKRDAAVVKAKIASKIPQFLNIDNKDVLVSVAKLAGELGISEYNTELKALVKESKYADVRGAALTALAQLGDTQLTETIRLGMADKDKNVRTTAVGFLGKIGVQKEELPLLVQPIFEKGSIQEQQQLLKVLGEMPADNTRVVLSSLINDMKAEKLSPSVKLELLEAIDKANDTELSNQSVVLRAEGTTAEAFKETLYGGNSWQGRNFFMTNSTGQCVRCHSLGADVEGGAVGPNLQHIGSTLSREQILQALIEPSTRLAPGFGTVQVTLTDGQEVTGTLLKENDHELEIKTSEAEPLRVPLTRIKNRQNFPSSMPPMGSILSKREIRDVVEFLATMK